MERNTPETVSNVADDVLDGLKEKLELSDSESGGEMVASNCDLWVRPKHSVNMIDVKSNLLQIDIDFNKKTEQALIDTGSCRSLISYNMVNDCCIDCTEVLRVFGIAEVGGIIAIGKIKLATIVNGISMKPHEFIVIPSSVNLPTSIVLGTDFLRANKFEINVLLRKLTWHDNNSVIDLYLDQEGTVEKRVIRKLPCYALSKANVGSDETTELLVGSSTVLSNVSGKETLLYSTGFSKGRGKDLAGISGIVSDNAQHIRILMTNFGHTNSIIQKGQLVGFLSTVVELTDDGSNVEEQWTRESLQAAVDLSGLSEEQKTQVWGVVEANQMVLSMGDHDIGQVGITAHRIELYDETPIYQKPRRFPPPVAEEIEGQCQGLLQLGIIEPSASPWSSPVVPIRKKDGSIRLCVDYRLLNKVTKPDKFPMPNLTDSIFSLHGIKYFTKLDLVRGYYQVNLEDSSKEFTAFSTPHGHYQFNRLSFGLRNAPAAFQREMQEVLREFPWKKVVVYIDDILIMETSFEKHVELVGQVLQTLKIHGIKIKPEKCEWCRTEVEFLGHIVSREGVKKTKSYVDKVDCFQRPTTVRELREFLGLINFQRKFIPNCSVIQKPLSAVTGGGGKKKLLWTSEMEAAFNALRQAVKEDIQLAFPNYGPDAEKLELWVDASMTGAGACLTQIQQGQLRVIAFASMNFEGAQRNYSTLDKELAAMRWGIKCFRAFLYGIEFVLRTDHQPLVYLHNMRIVDSRLARTLENLADFNFTILYTPGRLNTAADALSRLKPLLKSQDDCSNEGELPVGLMLDGSAVPGGGNSLFISLLRALQGACGSTESLPKTDLGLRQQLVDELLQHPKQYQLSLNRNLRRDLRLMRHNHQLPCFEVLLAASSLHRVQVHVYFWSDSPVVFTAPSSSGKPWEKVIHLQCLAGIHFNPLVELKNREVNIVPNCIITTSTSPTQESGGEEESLHDDEDDHVCTTDAKLFEEMPECGHSLGGQPAMNVGIGGENYCALLDTGAEISLINENVLKSLAQYSYSNVGQAPGEMIGFTGKREVLKGSIDLQINIGSFVIENHTFAIVSDGSIPCCFLLGIDFLMAHSLSLDLDSGMCKQHNLDYTTVGSLMFGESATTYAGYAGAVKPLAEDVSRICIGSPARNLPFQLTWQEGSLSTMSSLFEYDAIKQFQQRTRQLRCLKHCINNEINCRQWPKSVLQFKRYSSKIKIENEILVFDSNGIKVPIVSFNLLVEVVLVLHHQFSHIGRDKVINLLGNQVWHPSAYKVASDVCTTCKTCQLFKISPIQIAPPTWKIETKVPFELMAADLVEFGKTASGYIGCLMIVDHNSKWLAAVPIKNKKSITVVNALENNVFPFLPRLPDNLLTDNGPEFSSDTFSTLMQKYGIKHIFTTPYKPSSNGAVERINRTIGSFLASFDSSPLHWDQNLTKSVLTYNNTVHTEIQTSPAEYILTRAHSLKVPPILSDEVRGRWKVGHPKFVPFRVGQKVMRKVPTRGHCNIDKFKPRFEGPFIISKVHANDVAYELVLPSKPNVLLRSHYTQLRAWSDPPPYLCNHDYYKLLFPTSAAECSDERDPPDDYESSDSDFVVTEYSSEYSSYESTTSDSSPECVSSVVEEPDLVHEVPDTMVSITKPSGLDYSSVVIEEPVRILIGSQGPRPSKISTPAIREGGKPFSIYSAERIDNWEMSNVDGELVSPTIDYSRVISQVEEAILSEIVEAVASASETALTRVNQFIEECSGSSNFSFFGFEEIGSGSPVLNKLAELQATVREVLSAHRRYSRGTPRDRNEELNVSLPAVRRHTRSQGPVPEYSNVQPGVLERKN